MPRWLKRKAGDDLAATRVGTVRKTAGSGAVAHANPGLDNVASPEISVLDNRSVAYGIKDIEGLETELNVHRFTNLEYLCQAPIETIDGVNWDAARPGRLLDTIRIGSTYCGDAAVSISESCQPFRAAFEYFDPKSFVGGEMIPDATSRCL